MRRKAYGKITLYLKVTGRHQGNLHFDNITVPIDLFDMVYLEKNDRMEIKTDKSYLPNDKRNTVYQAISIMKERYHIKDNFAVKIVKNIPAQSGLGGGSADAAAVIHMLNDLYHLNLDNQALIEVGKMIDEDTVFCLFNQPAHIQGYGDKITFLENNMELHYLLIKPPYGISTKRFMKSFKNFSKDKSKASTIIEALKVGDFSSLVDSTHNDFQKNVMKRNKYIKKIIKDMQKYELEGVTMTGSGSSVFGLSQDQKKVQEAYEALVLKYPFIKYGKIL